MDIFVGFKLEYGARRTWPQESHSVGLIIWETYRIFLAVPYLPNKDAAVWVYTVQE